MVRFRIIPRLLLKLVAAYTRYFPFRKGKGLIVDIMLSIKMPDMSIITKSEDGRLFEFNPHTRHAYQIFFWGTREPNETALVRDIVRAGDSVIDVGANIGWYTSLMSSIVGRRGVVIAIEPVPASFSMLQRTITLNEHLDNTLLMNRACSDHLGFEKLYEFPSLHPGLSSSRPIGELESEEHVIPAVSLDAIIEDRELSTVHFVKIDVEGAELSVIKGSRNAITSGIIQSLMIEANEERSAAFGYSFVQCNELILSLNPEYIFFIIKNNGQLDKMKHVADFANGDNLFIVLKGSEIWNRIANNFTGSDYKLRR
jgi:FkbM family methyltransferase